MIDSKELMIGNYISDKYEDYYKVVGLKYTFGSDDYDIYYKVVGKNQILSYKRLNTEFMPIPLSANLLSMIEGFEEYQKDCWQFKINADYKIDYSLYENKEWELTIDSDEVLIPLWIKITFLHQLQNLIFCLSGNELKLNFSKQ